MNKLGVWIAVVAIAIPLTSCVETGTEEGDTQVPAMVVEAPAPIYELPISTNLESAREHFMSGVQAADLGRFLDAREHFEQATALDPTFASAYLNLANAAVSLEEFTTNLKRAEEAASYATPEEQLLIEIARKGFDSDVEGQYAKANELMQTAIESPRAWLAVATVQSNLNHHDDARLSLQRALGLAPNMVAAHMQAGNSYLFAEPRDLDKAETHMKNAVELAPTEPNPHDLLGDVYRAQGELEKSREAYTEAAKFSGTDGSPYQQRGHVNSFLGDFEAARADYDKSISMARDNQAASFGVYRAFVNVHAGDPAAAIEELETHASKIDNMNVPEPTGLKIFALGDAATIALHHDMLDKAEQLTGEWTTLMRAQSDQIGTDEFYRGQEAAIAFREGLLATKKGDFSTAVEKADAIARFVEPDANPRKLEPVHELKGAIAYEQGNFEEAAGHLRQGNVQNNIYVKYYLAKSLEGAGQTEEANRLFQEVATWNFNGVGAALTRREAMQKVGMS